MLEDKPWALRNKLPKNSVEVPVGDRCESCFQTWKTSFTHLSWEEMCERVKSEPATKKAFREAQATMADPSSRPWQSSQVLSETNFVLEICKHYICLSEKELRKQVPSAKGSKIPKSILQSLPSVQMAGPDGEVEELFLFRHPSEPFRTATLRSMCKQVLSTELMAASSHNYEQQATDLFRHRYSKFIDEQGVKTVLNKEPNILSLEEFCDKSFFKKLEHDPGGKGCGSDAEDDDDSSLMNLVGSAAPTIARASSASSIQEMPSVRKPGAFTTPKQSKSHSKTAKDVEEVVMEGGDAMDGVGSVSGKDSLLTSLDRSGEKKGEQWTNPPPLRTDVISKLFFVRLSESKQHCLLCMAVLFAVREPYCLKKLEQEKPQIICLFFRGEPMVQGEACCSLQFPLLCEGLLLW